MLCRLLISLFSFVLMDSYNKYNNSLVDRLIDQLVATTAQVDHISILQAI